MSNETTNKTKKDEVNSKAKKDEVNSKTKKDEVNSKKNKELIIFIVSICFFFIGIAFWVLYRNEKQNSELAKKSLIGASIGVLVIFLIGCIWGGFRIGK